MFSEKDESLDEEGFHMGFNMVFQYGFSIWLFIMVFLYGFSIWIFNMGFNMGFICLIFLK